jgi:hypothetical protein
MDAQEKTGNLSVLLGVEFANVKKLERLILKLEQETNKEDIEDCTTVIQSTLEHLFDSHSQFDQMAAINVQRRSAFSDSLHKSLLNQKSHIPEQQWSALEGQLERLNLFCGIDFTRKPLSFAREALDKWRILEPCEESLLGLINAMRMKDGLDNVFEEAHAALINRRRDIVITCMGPVKSSKSSVVNYFLQRQVCPVGTEETTARVTLIQYGERTTVTLCSAEGVIKEKPYNIEDDQHLAQVTMELIHLKGKEREDINLCTDVVKIELKMEELKQIQLYDIPGIDENSTLKKVVDNILAKTDIVFAITPLDEALRESFVLPIQRWLKAKQGEVDHVCVSKRHPCVCFLASKIDNFTNNKLSNLTYEDIVKHLSTKINVTLDIKSDHDADDAKLSYPLIPLCTHPLHSVTDYLTSYRDFTEKSKQFLNVAVTDITQFRLDFLMRTMHKMFDCDDLKRRAERVKRLEATFTKQSANLETEVEEQLCEPFDAIFQTILSNINHLFEKDTISFNNRKKQDMIKERVRNILREQFEKAMQDQKENIQMRLILLMAKLLSSPDIDPQQTQLVEEALQHTVMANPYSIALGQYDSRFGRMTDYAEVFLQKYFKDKFPSCLSAYIPLSPYVSFVALLITPFQHKWLARQQIEDLVERSVSDTLQHLRKQTLKAVENSIKSQLTSVSEHLRRDEWRDISQYASNVASYLSNNKEQVARLCLDILDNKFRLLVPKCIISDTKIGESNSPVYVGRLTDENGVDKKIAAKIMLVNKFNLQEVRYINVLNHPNILHFYGVRKSDKRPDHYEIIMQWLPSDLSEYLKWKKSREQLTGECIDSILSQIVQGLAYMHKSGFFHRDIKPQNILVHMKEPQPPLCLIADFGLIHREPLSLQGTPGYLAPELIATTLHNRPFITMKTDMYALGVTIDEIIKTSDISHEDKYVAFWMAACKRCINTKPEDRTKCTDIIEQRKHLEQ